MQNLMPPVDTPDKAFHDGNPLTGELGTIVTALFMNNVQAAIRNAQAEIIAIMADAGIATDAGKSDQLLAALKKTFALNASPVLTGNPAAPTQLKTDNSTKLATTAHVKLVAADYAPLANPALTGAPTAPTAAAGTNTAQIATTAFVTALAASKADLASPALTGTPTAPTAATATSNTQIATTAFVMAAIASLVDSAPGALDTLNELAAAIGDDPNFSVTMTNLIAGKAGLASPAFTGTPTAPTAAAATNNTQIATTAHVKTAIAAGTAAAATKLATPRKINGVPFDGTADINLTPQNLGFGEVWFSERRRMILNEPIIIEHRISELNVDSCVTDVMIVCVADSENYKAGDVLMCPAGLISIAGASRYLPLTAGISTTHIQFNVPNRGLFGCDKLSGGGIVIGTQNEMNNWVAVLKIIKF